MQLSNAFVRQNPKVGTYAFIPNLLLHSVHPSGALGSFDIGQMRSFGKGRNKRAGMVMPETTGQMMRNALRGLGDIGWGQCVRRRSWRCQEPIVWPRLGWGAAAPPSGVRHGQLHPGYPGGGLPCFSPGSSPMVFALAWKTGELPHPSFGWLRLSSMMCADHLTSSSGYVLINAEVSLQSQGIPNRAKGVTWLGWPGGFDDSEP